MLLSAIFLEIYLSFCTTKAKVLKLVMYLLKLEDSHGQGLNNTELRLILKISTVMVM